MADRMADGSITVRWDERASSSIVSGFDELRNDVNRYRAENKEALDRLEHECATAIGISEEKVINKSFVWYREMSDRHITNYRAINTLAITLTPFLLCGPMRFLNYFFKWYLLEIEYSMYAMPYVAISSRGDPWSNDYEIEYKTRMDEYRKELKLLRKRKTVTSYKELIKNTLHMMHIECEEYMKNSK